jgi:hypothetical protein
MGLSAAFSVIKLRTCCGTSRSVIRGGVIPADNPRSSSTRVGLGSSGFAWQRAEGGDPAVRLMLGDQAAIAAVRPDPDPGALIGWGNMAPRSSERCLAPFGESLISGR